MSTRRRLASELKTRLAGLSRGLRASGSYRRYLRGEGGAVAIYFGLSALVFIGVAGLAVDAARGYLVKARLSEAIDAAALAGGKALALSNDQKVLADANAFFDANFPDGAMGAAVANPQINILNNRTIVRVTANAVIPTTLMRVLGFQNMTMAAAAEVSRATTGLDVVFSFDVSGSMGSPISKIQALRANATSLVDTLMLPFTSGGQSQTVTVNGVNYSLLNIGVVPWNSKVNVRTRGQEGTATTVTTTTVPGFTDPTLRTGGTLTTIYNASNSQVPLLRNPNTISGGWRGCVYARYMDDGNNTNDADTMLGSVTVGTKTWPAWEPVPINEGDTSNCDAMFWNSNPAVWPFNNTGSFSGTARPPNAAWPNPASPTHDFFDNCDTCPSVGIQPMTSNATTVKNMISALVHGGATDAPQGLFWAWEVLMPGAPFNEAVVNPPFQRAQAIVFMTDGQNFGSNGDAYHGWFGTGTPAGTISSKGNITIPHSGASVNNNLDNRLLQLAARIKGANPMDPAAVKIYVIQYVENNPALAPLLQQVATQGAAPYYFFAPDNAALAAAFNEIAASLSALRIVK